MLYLVILRAKEHLVETSASFTEIKLSTDLENLYCFNFLHIGLSVRYKISSCVHTSDEASRWSLEYSLSSHLVGAWGSTFDLARSSSVA